MHASARRFAIGAIASILWVFALPAPAGAQGVPPGVGAVSLAVLSPTAIVDVAGSHTGSVGALAVRDESGTSDDRAGFVRLSGGHHPYVGERTYTLPPSISPADVTTIALTGNFRGPIASRIAWTWSIYDVATGGWARLGTQNHCGGDAGTAQWPCDDLNRRPWKYVRWNVIHAPGAALADFVDPVTREIRVRLRSSAPSAAKLDWEALEVYSSHGTPPAVWTPSVGARWQWQLQGKPGSHAETGGIAVGICRPPFGGGACVRPDVFDFDLYVDPSIAGRFGYQLETAAVDAVHASGR
ncbi:MAG: hypothetical protein ACXVP7_05030, partial [Actinomycetota bacterium]